LSELGYSLEMASGLYLIPTFLLMCPEKQRERCNTNKSGEFNK